MSDLPFEIEQWLITIEDVSTDTVVTRLRIIAQGLGSMKQLASATEVDRGANMILTLSAMNRELEQALIGLLDDRDTTYGVRAIRARAALSPPGQINQPVQGEK